MADFLIKHLTQKGTEHSALAMLVNQWSFDEKLIPKALQNIGNLFPHYSRHDESHSRTILTNIERILGDNISLLTATDTWLLLEAAYWHDIGMVVPRKDIEDAMREPDFDQYIRNIRDSPNHELYRFSQKFNSQYPTEWYEGADTPIEAIDKFGQLMAEWFRQQHAERSEKIVHEPWISIGLTSPRTELIPARLFKVLGRICHMHGMPFHELFSQQGLPFKEAGLAQEDCHPRFIACLLRIGDLLDLDDNRFCPVMQRIAGQNRPSSSRAHEDKHSAIRHFRIDRERIEITAECETIEGYMETFKWLDWLREELKVQVTNWHAIAPSRALGLLPTLGDVVVRLSGEFQILTEGHRPQFSVDNDKAIDLLQGSNLYQTKFVCIRELLQNSVDATLLRIWLVENKSQTEYSWDSPFNNKIRDIFNNYKIKVIMDEVHQKIDMDDDKSLWTLRITDNGTGISREDLKYMLSIGGSNNNLIRQKNIVKMPEWMKPSGTFGIGFQSVFLVSDEVRITTKSIFTNETLQITMHSPTSAKEGLVLLKVLNNDIAQSYGTKIEIDIVLEKFASSWSISMSDEESIARKFVMSLDPILDVSFPYDAAKLADQIIEFSRYSFIPIEGNLIVNGKSIALKAENNTLARDDNWNFIKIGEDQVAISYRPLVLHPHPAKINMFYRGQEVEVKSVLSDVEVRINLFSGKASKWLTANREHLANHAEDKFYDLVLAALEQQVRLDLDNPDSSLHAPGNKPSYAFFLEAMALRYEGVWQKMAKEIEGAWLDLPLLDNNITPRSYFRKSKWIIGEVGVQGEPKVQGCDALVSNS